MRVRTVLLACTVAVSGLLAGGASADPCVKRGVRLFETHASVCVAEQGCVVYAESGSLVHTHDPVCALPYPG